MAETAYTYTVRIHPETGSKSIMRSDGASFTEDYGNSDFRAYQEWLAEGNTPEPWPPAE